METCHLRLRSCGHENEVPVLAYIGLIGHLYYNLTYRVTLKERKPPTKIHNSGLTLVCLSTQKRKGYYIEIVNRPS